MFVQSLLRICTVRRTHTDLFIFLVLFSGPCVSTRVTCTYICARATSASPVFSLLVRIHTYMSILSEVGNADSMNSHSEREGTLEDKKNASIFLILLILV